MDKRTPADMLAALRVAARSTSLSLLPVEQELDWGRAPIARRVEQWGAAHCFPEWKLREVEQRLELKFSFLIDDGLSVDAALSALVK